MSGARETSLEGSRSQSRSDKPTEEQRSLSGARKDSTPSLDSSSVHQRQSLRQQQALQRDPRARSKSKPRYQSEDGLKPSLPSVEPTFKEGDSVISSLARATWPPENIKGEINLSQKQAEALIAMGAPIFKGIRKSIPHASTDYYALYAICEGAPSVNDGATLHSPAFAATTFNVYDTNIAARPWETLEQPSLAFCYGYIPGTITLNHWASLSGRLKPNIDLKDPQIKPRDVALSTIIDRLIYLEGGFEEDDEELMYRNLYKKFLKDPDRIFRPHKAMEKQIADLIFVLSGPDWIDFSDPRNQVVGKFFSYANYAEEDKYKKFFYQLLLSMELDVRINSKHHAKEPKQKLISQLPPCIVWDLALSRKWRECTNIQDFNKGNGSDKIKIHLRNRKQQVKALRQFIRAMKWPSLNEVDNILKQSNSSAIALQDRSSDALSYFSGVVLPGLTLPFLLMNTIVDCDRENTGSELAGGLTHMFPHCGFQYRTSTYWSSACIVGKVLAPSSREIAGWVGPTMSSSDLGRIQIARVRQRPSKQNITAKLVQSIQVRSDPLGPPPSGSNYPVVEYQLVLPDVDNKIDTIRIEKLALKEVSNTNKRDKTEETRPKLLDASIRFAVDGKSWPLHLAFDVSFISAYPCKSGPHPLFYDYVYKAVKVDEILTIADWGGLAAMRNNSGNFGASALQNNEARQDGDDAEKVLVVEAFGVPDNEILARAWASHWGLNAIIANIEETCMACAIREGYAACVNVVILTNGPFSSL